MSKPANPNTGTFVVVVDKIDVREGVKMRYGTMHGTVATERWDKDAKSFVPVKLPMRFGIKSPWADRLAVQQHIGRTLTVTWELGAHAYNEKVYPDYNVTNIVGLEAPPAPAPQQEDDLDLPF